MSLTHAFEFLVQPPDDSELPLVAAVFGSDGTLRGWSMAALTSQGDVTEYDGESTRWADLRDDLATASLFDLGGKRTIAIRDADKFVSENRGELEAYLARPGTASRLILDLHSLASNTRIYKSLLKDHVLIACSSGADKKLGVTAASRRKFLTTHVAGRHQAKLAAAAADALVEMLGDDIGLLDTEIAKLALYCDVGETISESMVHEIVAGWQGKTVWQITDAIAAGNAAEALKQLDKLFGSGQKPIALLPQIAWSLRRLGMATAVVDHRERSGRSWQLDDALSAAGIYRPQEVSRARSHLKGLGRTRARKLLPWLLDADLRLKGTHSADGRDRFLLEQFVMRLAKSEHH